MNRQRKVLITVTYNEMGIIIDTKAEKVAQPNLQPTCNNLATDTISRQTAINYVDDIPYIKEHPNLGLIWKEWIEALPSVQPQQKTGRWIYDGEYKNGMMRMKCSNCRAVIETFDSQSRLRYCQNCGAKMEV